MGEGTDSGAGRGRELQGLCLDYLILLWEASGGSNSLNELTTVSGNDAFDLDRR